MSQESTFGRRTRLRFITVGTALALAAISAPARAQLGTYAGCTIYSCYRFTLSEVARTGPLMPFPGGPPPSVYPHNVPSYLVQYRMDVTARVLAQAVTDGVTDVSPSLPWFFNDGAYGDGGCCMAFGTFAFAGLAAGTELAWSSATFALPDMQAYLAVDSGPGAAGVSLGMLGFEIAGLARDPYGAFNELEIAPEVSITSTPEPATLALVATGLAAVAALSRRRGRAIRVTRTR